MCDLVELASDDSVLEIGCGWGGLINYIKRRYSCDTKAITISEEQYKFVTKKNTALNSNDKSVVNYAIIVICGVSLIKFYRLK